ncbi:MAG: FMN-binding glutamate synthase family protein [Gammaproteobacteria bacterium]|jgi:glutamate synthase domain-containing protein 2|nr:FMN-binding glutamate synthase family protein [Gammaproteobacteria bacterium]
MVRNWFYGISAGVFVLVGLIWLLWPPILWGLVLLVPLFLVGLRDATQIRHTILRNFPLIGHGRYLIEGVRPELQQYLIESNLDAYPVEREYRSLVYQRAKSQVETRPLGTQRDVYRVGYEWASHSLAPVKQLEHEPRINFGGADCSKPYSASHLNISAMSFGALSSRAVLALNEGAKLGGFAHNTGEGGVSRHHLQPGGDLIWQVGTGYFGCRQKDGSFDPERFRETAANEQIRMIEIKLSQGAKPGHGGILPAVKVTPEIAEARGLEPYETALSPPWHSEFSTPIGLIEFVVRLRELSGGKPVGIKFCVGRRTDFLAICKAMLEVGTAPDFITVDGGEGGTGAAPLEFSNSIGMPGRDALPFVVNSLIGAGLRDKLRVIYSGKVFSAFHMIRALALGADTCNSARGMMFALGCIQALRCNTNNCPTGITTQNPALVKGLHVASKAVRVHHFHRATIHALLEMLAAMGMQRPDEVRPDHVYRRVDDLNVRTLSEIYPLLKPGALLGEELSSCPMASEWRGASAERWSFQAESGESIHS